MRSALTVEGFHYLRFFIEFSKFVELNVVKCTLYLRFAIECFARHELRVLATHGLLV